MDAKVADWGRYSPHGKTVEINALWINALDSMAQFATLLEFPAARYLTLGAAAKDSFSKFWNSSRNCCYDVIDSPPIGNDASLRPNQILAVSLPSSPLNTAQRKAVVDICRSELLTPVGLRSLGPHESGYTSHYSGGPRERDAAYHQGTVWGWLLGPFALAHFSRLPGTKLRRDDSSNHNSRRWISTDWALCRNLRWRTTVCTTRMHSPGLDGR